MKTITIFHKDGSKTVYDDIVSSGVTAIGYHLEHKDGKSRYVHPIACDSILVEGEDEEYKTCKP